MFTLLFMLSRCSCGTCCFGLGDCFAVDVLVLLLISWLFADVWLFEFGVCCLCAVLFCWLKLILFCLTFTCVGWLCFWCVWYFLPLFVLFACYFLWLVVCYVCLLWFIGFVYFIELRFEWLLCWYSCLLDFLQFAIF